MKALILNLVIKILMGAIALGIGIWYLSSSIGGAALTYSSTSNFLTAIGVENGDISTANGCFLCKYVTELFGVLGQATEYFWNIMIENLWVLVSIGFGIYLFIYTIKFLYNHAAKNASLDAKPNNISFKDWFEPIWKLTVRILIVGALLGTISIAGTDGLKAVADILITPVLYISAQLSMAASGISDAATCYAISSSGTSILSPILQPFMCVMGNINSVMLAGAAGGFALMNYAWLGLGGGAFTWIAGLGLVTAFLIIGFDLAFQILSVVFKLIFIIIFLPFILVAAAFEKTWSMADKIFGNSIKLLINSAIKLIVISLKTIIIFATVSFAADEFFPGPSDGYSAIFPTLLGQEVKNEDAQTLSVINVFSTCEKVALVDGELDKEIFTNCFTAKKAEVERKYPGAFDFMKNGWNFIIFMIGIFALYFYVIKPKVDGLLAAEGKEQFDFGKWTKDLGKKLWSMPQQIFTTVSKALGKK